MSMEELKKLSIQQEEKKGSSSNMDDLLSFNSLVYSLPMVNSLVTRRSLQTYTFDSTSYNQDSGQLTVVLNSGEQFLNFKNSYLQLDIAVTSSQNRSWDFGRGSALNLFETTEVVSRQGTVLSRNQQNNVYQIQEHKTKKSQEWFDSQGFIMGYNDIKAQGYAGYAHTAPVTVIIPLQYVNSLFDSQMLCPDSICSGARLILSLERLNNAIRYIVPQGEQATTGKGFTITNPKVVVDAHTLADSAYKSLALTGARNGLEYVVRAVHHESTPVTTNFNTSISKSVARALEVVAVPRLDASINDADADSLVTPTIAYTDFQIQLGSHLLPQRKLEGNLPIYANILYSTDQFSDIDGRGSYLSQEDFTTNGYGHLRQNLQTQSLLDLSGTSCNNSRQVRINGSMSTGGAKTFDVFMSYMAVIRAFRTNVAVTS